MAMNRLSHTALRKPVLTLFLPPLMAGCFVWAASTRAEAATLAPFTQSTPVAAHAPTVQKTAQAQQAPAKDEKRQVARFGDWGAYVAQSGGVKLCYAMSQPVARSPEGLKRDPAFVFVSFRPAENVRGEVSFIMGFAFKSDAGGAQANGTQAKDAKAKVNPAKGPPASSAPTGNYIDIGTSKLALGGKDGNAFLQNAAQENALLALMAKAPKMDVHMVSLRGNQTVDSYSLNGFVQALAQVKKDCP